MWRLPVLALVASVALLLAPARPASAQVGAVSVMVPVASRIEDGASLTALALRDPVFLDDRIATSTDGSTRITFADSSELTIGPNSDVVIDRFVYSPVGIESAFLRLGVGAVRFVGGSVQQRLIVAGPTASVGLRGTVFDFYVDFGGGELLQVHRGFVVLTLRDAGRELRLGPGQFALVRDGGVIVGPATEPVLAVMDRYGFAYPRGLAREFLAAADAPSLVPFAEVDGIIAAARRPVRGCGELVAGTPEWYRLGCGPAPGRPAWPADLPGFNGGGDRPGGTEGGGSPDMGQGNGTPGGNTP